MRRAQCGINFHSFMLQSAMRVAMGGSLHDARLGFFGLSRARHKVHGLHGARRKGACTMHDKLARFTANFCEHKNTLRTIPSF